MSSSNNIFTVIVRYLFLFRIHNIFFIVIAQFFSALFVFSTLSFLEILNDRNIFLLIFSSVFIIMAGYIINDFFDKKKDFINYPLRLLIENKISSSTKLYLYILLNSIGLILSSLVSFRAFLFFAFYLALIALYSIRLSKVLLVRNLISVFLYVIPIFAIALYYKNFNYSIFLNAFLLTIILLVKSLIKDLINTLGDISVNVESVPLIYGETKTKIVITVLTIVIIFTDIILINEIESYYRILYLQFLIPFFIILIVTLWFFKNKLAFFILNNLIKFIIVLGILFLIFIEK